MSLETGETMKSFEYGKESDFVFFAVSGHLLYSRDFVVFPVSRHFLYSRDFVCFAVSGHFPCSMTKYFDATKSITHTGFWGQNRNLGTQFSTLF